MYGWSKTLRGLEPALHVLREAVLEQVQHDRDLAERLALLRVALDLEAAVDPLQVVRADLEQVRRRPAGLLLDLGGRALDRAGEHHRGAGAARPGGREPVAAAVVDDRDVVRVAVELLGDELRDHRLRAVAPERAGVQRRGDPAGGVDLERHATPASRSPARPARRTRTRTRSRENTLRSWAVISADADVPALLARSRRCSARQWSYSASSSAWSSTALVVAGVVDVAGRDEVREVALDEVHPADLATGSRPSSRAALSTICSSIQLFTSEPKPR